MKLIIKDPTNEILSIELGDKDELMIEKAYRKYKIQIQVCDYNDSFKRLSKILEETADPYSKTDNRIISAELVFEIGDSEE